MSGRRAEQHPWDSLRQQGGVTLPGKGEKFPTLEEQERTYIQWVLNEFDGNQTAAAAALGINRSSLWRKLKNYQDAE